MSDELELVGRRSYARCEERWVAAGVDPALAAELSRDSAVGQPPPELLPTDEEPLRVLVAGVGAGKSLISERALQQVVDVRRADAGAPIPVWLRVRDVQEGLETAVVRAAEGIGDPYAEPIFLVLDGADEPGLGRAAESLRQARELVRVLPEARVLLSTRPLPPFEDAPEAIVVPPLSEGEAHRIVERVSGIEVGPGRAAGWPKTVQEAITRPLFAVLLGAYLRRHDGQQPGATAELLRDLISVALRGAPTDRHEALRRIGVLASAAGGGPVPKGEAGALDELEALAETRLVVLDEHHIRFPLILIAHWFAAESLARGETPMEALVQRPEDLELWRYPLALAVGAFGQQEADRVLAPLVEAHAGFASQIVEEGLARWGDSAGEPAAAQAAGERIRAAMSSWMLGVGPLAPTVVPLTADGRLAALGIHSEGEFLSTGWDRSGTDDPAIRDLPGSAFSFFAGAVGQEEGFAWSRVRSARVGHQPAWPWRWSFEDMRSTLSGVLRQRALDLTEGPLAAARLWHVARVVFRLPFTAREPVPVARLMEALDTRADFVAAAVGPTIAVKRNRQALQTLIDQGVESIPPPFEPPRLDFAGGWSWDAWTTEGHLVRARQVYELALAGFEHLIAGPFAALAPWMQTASTLPARVNVRIVFSGDPGLQGAPIADLWLDPLPAGSDSEVHVWQDEGRFNWEPEDWEPQLAELRRLRPRQARWLDLSISGSVLDLDDDTAAEEVIYKWLWDDLTRIKWVDGLLGTRPRQDLLL